MSYKYTKYYNLKTLIIHLKKTNVELTLILNRKIYNISSSEYKLSKSRLDQKERERTNLSILA